MSPSRFVPFLVPRGIVNGEGVPLKFCVYPHELSLGGSQIITVELAAAVRDRGHEALVFGVPGPLLDYVEKLALPFVPAPPARSRLAPSRVLALRNLAARERVDLVHVYEWAPCVEAYYGVRLIDRVPLVCSVMEMSARRPIPRSLPLIMGTAELGQEARRNRTGPVEVIEPAVDTKTNHPSFDASSFLREHGLDDGRVNVVVVSRLTINLKLDALERVIDAIAALAHAFPARLVIVGDGDASDALRRRAAAVNATHNRRVVVLTGPLLDPRAAYAAADVVVGMGLSVLRGMAFGKAAVVQGSAGFSEVCSPDTAALFLAQGFYGVGDGTSRLKDQLARLLSDGGQRRRLGEFNRRLIEDRFSLHAASARLEKLYAEWTSEQATTRPPLREPLRLAGALGVGALHQLVTTPRRRADRLRQLARAAGGTTPTVSPEGSAATE